MSEDWSERSDVKTQGREHVLHGGLTFDKIVCLVDNTLAQLFFPDLFFQ